MKIHSAVIEGIKNNAALDPHQEIQPLLDSYIKNSHSWMLDVLSRTS